MNPTSPYTDTTVTNGNCYKYQYVVTDQVGNQLVATAPTSPRSAPSHRAPTGTSATLTATEDTPRTLTTADFGFGDALDEEPHALLAVKVTTLPAAGTLKLNGTTVTAGQYVSAADIASGLLVFHPAANGNGTPYTSFTFQVQDNGGTASGGSDLDASPNTLTFNVTAVNDTPSFTKGADQSVVRDTGAYSIPNWATNISAGPANEASQTLTFTVTTPASPNLFTVKPAISPTGTLTYTLRPGASGTTTITVKVKDNGGGGGLATSPNQTFVITVIPTNRGPGEHRARQPVDGHQHREGVLDRQQQRPVGRRLRRRVQPDPAPGDQHQRHVDAVDHLRADLHRGRQRHRDDDVHRHADRHQHRPERSELRAHHRVQRRREPPPGLERPRRTPVPAVRRATTTRWRSRSTRSRTAPRSTPRPAW